MIFSLFILITQVVLRHFYLPQPIRSIVGAFYIRLNLKYLRDIYLWHLPIDHRDSGTSFHCMLISLSYASDITYLLDRNNLKQC